MPTPLTSCASSRTLEGECSQVATSVITHTSIVTCGLRGGLSCIAPQCFTLAWLPLPIVEGAGGRADEDNRKGKSIRTRSAVLVIWLDANADPNGQAITMP
eukprot:3880259-Amphidinium_carterae.1